MPLHPQYTYHPFFDDAFAHFADAYFAIDKSDGYFFDLEAEFPGGEFHFYLESIAYEHDLIEVDGFQYGIAIADKTRRGIINGHPGNEFGIKGASFGV